MNPHEKPPSPKAKIRGCREKNFDGNVLLNAANLQNFECKLILFGANIFLISFAVKLELDVTFNN